MSVIIPVILCGGSGSRLWPASRDSFPKQFLALTGPHSLFQDTLTRVTGSEFGAPIVVTGQDYRFLVAEQVRAAGTKADIILEPTRRDSCAAIAAAAEVAVARTPDALMLVLAADHAMPDPEAFRAHVRRGAPAAAAGRIVTFGIKPSKPATGYGYIRPGAELPGHAGVHELGAFVEKPDQVTAERYLAEGYLWNSGNFLFSAAIFLDELKQLAPTIAEPVHDAVVKGQKDMDFLRLNAESFARATSKSVDYAVMEKTARAAVVPSDFAWSDIGAWSAIWDLSAKDADGNGAQGDGVFLNAGDCYVHSPDMLTAVVGLRDVVVVTTRDAVLVAHKDKAEDVKKVVTQLQAAGRKEAVVHRSTFHTWGATELIETGNRYQVKRVRVNPGGKLSLQSHLHRSEHWVVVAGTARVTIGQESKIVGENQSIYIPLGIRHRLENPGRIPLEIVEVQSGSYLASDDVIRHVDEPEKPQPPAAGLSPRS